MIALILIVVFVVYVVIAFVTTRAVFRTTRSHVRAGLTSIAFVLIPTWDVVLGVPYWKIECASEGGQKVYKTVPIGKDSYTSSVRGTQIPEIKDMEVGKEYPVRIDGVEYKVKLIPDRKKLSDRFEIVVGKREGSRTLGVEREISYVKDNQTGELLGEATSFLYWGGWVANSTGYHVSAVRCPSEPLDRESTHASLVGKVFGSR